VTHDQIKIHLPRPRVPYVELLQIGQQTEFGRKRLELVVDDLKQHGFWSDHANPFHNRTESVSSIARCAISLGSEERLLAERSSVFKFFLWNNSNGTSVSPLNVS
jgi:hypothetical protein